MLRHRHRHRNWQTVTHTHKQTHIAPSPPPNTHLVVAATRSTKTNLVTLTLSDINSHRVGKSCYEICHNPLAHSAVTSPSPCQTSMTQEG